MKSALLLFSIVLASPVTAMADSIGVDVEIDVRPPPSPPVPSRPPEPHLPAVNHGWDTRNRLALALTTTAAASLATGERGQGFGGAVTFYAVGVFPLDMSIESVHERFADRSQTYIGYTLHVVDRQHTRRMQPFLAIPAGVAVVTTRDGTFAQGFYGIGGGARFRASRHWMPSIEIRLVHRQIEEMVPSETVVDARAGLMYLF